MYAKKFKSGNSLALRIPHKFAAFFHGEIFKISLDKTNRIVIEPEADWENIFNACYAPDFPDRETMLFSKQE